MSGMDAITPMDLQVGDVFTEDGGEPYHIESAGSDWVSCRGLYSKAVMHRHRTSSWAGWGDLTLIGRTGEN